MKRRFVVIATLLLAAATLTVPSTPTTKAAPPVDCPATRQICWQIYWGGLYPLCLETIGTTSTCQMEASVNYANCVTDSSNGQCSALPRVGEY